MKVKDIVRLVQEYQLDLPVRYEERCVVFADEKSAIRVELPKVDAITEETQVFQVVTKLFNPLFNGTLYQQYWSVSRLLDAVQQQFTFLSQLRSSRVRQCATFDVIRWIYDIENEEMCQSKDTLVVLEMLSAKNGMQYVVLFGERLGDGFFVKLSPEYFSTFEQAAQYCLQQVTQLYQQSITS